MYTYYVYTCINYVDDGRNAEDVRGAMNKCEGDAAADLAEGRAERRGHRMLTWPDSTERAHHTRPSARGELTVSNGLRPTHHAGNLFFSFKTNAPTEHH